MNEQPNQESAPESAPASPAQAAANSKPDAKPIPRLPRGAKFKLRGSDVFRILLFGTLLAGVLLLRKPCADGVGRFVESFDVDAAVESIPPDASTMRPIGGFVHLTADMSEEEIQEKLHGMVGVHDAGPGDASPGDARLAPKD